MLVDLKLAVRRLLATPGFTVFAILSLAVGVAVTTAVYSVIHSVFLRESGIAEPDRVAFVVWPRNGRLVNALLSQPEERRAR